MTASLEFQNKKFASTQTLMTVDEGCIKLQLKKIGLINSNISSLEVGKISTMSNYIYGQYDIGAGQVLYPPVKPDNLPATVARPSYGTPICYCAPSYWKLAATVTAPLIIAIGTVLAAWIGLYKTDHGSSQTADKCVGAESHFNAANTLNDRAYKEKQLRYFKATFPGCGFDEDTAYALEDLQKTAELQQNVAPENGASVGKPLNFLPSGGPSIDEIAMGLAPVITRPNSLDLTMNYGSVAVLNPGVTYHLNLQRFHTTTINIRKGNVVVKKDRSPIFQCVEGNDFRLFTQGWSIFELKTNSYAQIQVGNIQNGDLTATTECTTPS